MIQETIDNFNEILAECKLIFQKKTQDYGTAWRILRISSITDQIFIKAKRIRSIQEKNTQKIEDDISTEFVGIINYCIIALLQMELIKSENMNLTWNFLEPKFDNHVKNICQLLKNKNHDYGEAWRDMRISSMVDIILMKLLRIKQIEDNEGKTIISESVHSGYQDILNYAVFCLIKLKNNENN